MLPPCVHLIVQQVSGIDFLTSHLERSEVLPFCNILVMRLDEGNRVTRDGQGVRQMDAAALGRLLDSHT